MFNFSKLVWFRIITRPVLQARNIWKYSWCTSEVETKQIPVSRNFRSWKSCRVFSCKAQWSILSTLSAKEVDQRNIMKTSHLAWFPDQWSPISLINNVRSEKNFAFLRFPTFCFSYFRDEHKLTMVPAQIFCTIHKCTGFKYSVSRKN